MNNKILWIIVVLAVIIGGFFAFNSYIYNEKQGPTDYKDATFIVEGESVTLIDGVSADGSVKYFGNQVKGDLDGDGIPDLAFLITKEGGGSGTFYYVVAAIQTPNNTYNGTHALFLGDRIAPQTTELSQNPNHKNVIVVNYAERAPGEPMTTRPSVGKSIWLKLDPASMQFGEVEQNFEGEADPSRMTLGMKTWNWVRALYNDGKEITPKQENKFTITFGDDGRFTATTDCNSMGGSYTATKDTIVFGPIAMTKMYCEGSQEADFAALLEGASGYHFTSKGELVFNLKFDSGTVTFR